MYFKASGRRNPDTNKSDWYYRLVESYRNQLGEVRQRNILSVGFMSEFSDEQIDQIQQGLNDRLNGQTTLFEDSIVQSQIEQLYCRMVREKKIDILQADKKRIEDWETVDLNSLKNKDVRDIGAEWLTVQAIKELAIEDFLASRGWSSVNIQLAISHLISRAVYPASELKTVRFMQDNSAVCELTGYPENDINHYKLYSISKALYKEKSGLEAFLSRKTNELFDLKDNIILYDLTNTYFEGEKRNSSLARYGRSKEKRSDCPLIVLALVVNVEGFVKHSAIYQGNMSDSRSLPDMIDKLRLQTSEQSTRALVVMDAGIATEDNLALVKSKGYDYICVSRSNLKKYKAMEGAPVVTVKDNKDRKIELQRVASTKDMEYYLKINSPAKALKEHSMRNQFQDRFEEQLNCIADSIHKRSGVKRYDKVCERIGRLKQKYPSVHRIYNIELTKNEEDICTSFTWKLIPQVEVQKKEEAGVYFLRTSLKEPEEELVWTGYNCIRNIESSFRCLKTDLDLRPIFHKTDEASEAHLHLGMLAYQIVNTIRYKLKQNGIDSSWKEIIRIMNTQKVVTTTVMNQKEQCISIRRCSEPDTKARLIYDAMGYKYAPFVRRKSVVPKINLENFKQTEYG